MKSSTAAKVALVAAAAFLVAAGATRLYYYTSPPTQAASSSTFSSSGSSTPAEAPPACGSQSTPEQPKGCWADYLGYLPAGYVLAPNLTNAPSGMFPCPAGMDPSQCAQFHSSCGNGVCDPDESCATCPIDCGVTGQLTCDLYTERAGIPSMVCQTLNQYGPIGGAG